jgi:hypothetical protein
VYVGSTVKGADHRVNTHRTHRREAATWNAALGAFLASGEPEYKELAIVPAEDRFRMEAQLIRALSGSCSLLNKYNNGYRHTPETRAKISLGVRRAWRLKKRPA